MDKTEVQKAMLPFMLWTFRESSLCAGGHRLTVIAAETRFSEASTKPSCSLLSIVWRKPTSTAEKSGSWEHFSGETVQFPSGNTNEAKQHAVKSCCKQGLGICLDEYIETRMNIYSWCGKFLFMSMPSKSIRSFKCFLTPHHLLFPWLIYSAFSLPSPRGLLKGELGSSSDLTSKAQSRLLATIFLESSPIFFGRCTHFTSQPDGSSLSSSPGWLDFLCTWSWDLFSSPLMGSPGDFTHTRASMHWWHVQARSPVCFVPASVSICPLNSSTNSHF